MFQKENSLSHVQAISHLQNLFPSIALPTFSNNIHLSQILQSITNTLPMPPKAQSESAILNMRSIVDKQQYKIQKNMLQIQKCCLHLNLNNEYDLDVYDQRSTAVDLTKKISQQTNGNSIMSDQSDDIWWSMDDKKQDDYEKECFSFLD